MPSDGSSILATLTEPGATAVLLLVLGVLMAVSVLFSRTTDRMGVPIVLLFLILGMLGGSEGPGGFPFDDYQIAVRLGTVALVLILFDGGLNTSMPAFRSVLGPATMLATVGVALTAGLLACFARLLGLPWEQALLLGAVVSSTDAAAVFAVLRGGRMNLKARAGRTVEVESCINDPMAVILTITMIQVMTAKQDVGWGALLEVPVQLAIGAVVGVLFGYLGRLMLRKVRLATVGLYPVLTLSLAFASFGTATLVNGSGFLAVFIAAMLLGGASLPYHKNLTRVHDAVAWLSQVGMFLMLGLLVFPSQLVDVMWLGLGLALLLCFVARPLATAPCLAPFGYTKREIAYISWAGLRGAVPIILGTLPVLAKVEGADRIFNLVFFIVVISSLLTGATLLPVTRWLKMGSVALPPPSAVIELNSFHKLKSRILSFNIDSAVAVCTAKLSEIEMPPDAAVIMIVRDQDIMAARGNTHIKAGDHVYVFCREEDRPFVELLFGQPEA